MAPNYEISGACGLALFAEANRDKGQCVRCIGLLGVRPALLIGVVAERTIHGF